MNNIIVIHEGETIMVSVLEKHDTYYLVGLNDGSMSTFKASIEHVKSMNQTTNSRGPMINLLDKIN